MSNPSLVAKLGIDEADFTRGLHASEEGLQRSQEKAKLLAAEMALLEQKMSSGKTDALVQQHKTLQTSLRETQAEAVAAAKQLRALEAVKPAAAPAPSAPDESARYDAHWKKLEEQERSRRAQEAMTRSHAPAPEMYGPPEAYGPPEPPRPASIKIDKADQYGPAASFSGAKPPLIKIAKPEQESEEKDDGKGGETGEGGGNRARNQELFHSARAVVDSLIAGQSPLRAIEQQAPRIFQAFGNGLGALARFAGPLAAVAAVGGLVKVVADAHAEAVKANEELDKLGRPHGSLGGTSASSALQHITDYTNPIATAQAGVDGGIGNGISNISGKIFETLTPFLRKFADRINSDNTGLGPNFNARLGFMPDAGNTREEQLRALQGQQATAVGLATHAQGRDNKLQARAFSEGSDNVASDKLEEEFKQRKDEIERLVAANPLLGDTDLVKRLREEIDLRKTIADLAHQTLESHRAEARDAIRITHPGLASSTSNTAKVEQTGSESNRAFQAPAILMRSHEVAGADAHYRSSLSRLDQVRGKGGDDRAATDDALRAEAAAQDAAIDRAQMTPQEQNAADRAQLTRDNLGQRLSNPGTHDSNKDGSYINNADGPDGSVIPDAGTGLGAINSAANDSTFDQTFHPSSNAGALPDRRPEIDASHANAGNGDAPKAVDSAGIIQAINNPTWAEKLSFDNMD